MKFLGQPNTHVIDYKRCKEVFCFDDKGEFTTNDEKLIAWIKKNKPFLKYEEEPQFKCKKCEATFDSKGKLLAHYREVHPKE